MAIYRNIIPVLITLALIVGGTLNFSFNNLYSVFPLFSVITVFFCALNRPSAIPLWLVFLLGIAQDALYGTTLGVSSMLLLFLKSAIEYRSEYILRRSFVFVWLVFALSVALYCICNTMIINLITSHWHEFNIKQVLVTIFIYPLIDKLFNMLAVVDRQKKTI